MSSQGNQASLRSPISSQGIQTCLMSPMSSQGSQTCLRSPMSIQGSKTRLKLPMPVRGDPYFWYIGILVRYQRRGQKPSIEKGQTTNYKITNNINRHLNQHFQ